jgi:rSAM/selenodomain-associated transferase 1
MEKVSIASFCNAIQTPQGKVNVEQLIVFLKSPRPGFVKTRLAAGLGVEAACKAYIRLAETMLEHIAPLQNVELRFTPDDSRPEIESWRRASWRASPQGPGNLGERLSRAIQESFAAGKQRVVVIGSDCPAVTAEDILSAWAALETHDVVLGPAHDGGYWLIGVRSPDAPVFEGISWSTRQVLEQTLSRCREARLAVASLRKLGDVDTIEDWRRFCDGQ